MKKERINAFLRALEKQGAEAAVLAKPSTCAG